MSTKKITRTKTGCLTCRRRRKKCDERKPECQNCLRNRFVCQGYQQQRKWQQSSTLCEDARSIQLTTEVAPNDANAINDWEDDVFLDIAAFDDYPNSGLPYLEFTSTTAPDFVDPELASSLNGWCNDTTAIASETRHISHPSPICENGGPVIESYEESGGSNATNSSIEMPGYWQAKSTKQTWHPSQLNVRPLPYLVDGIKTQTERKMFHHYYKVVSNILVLETSSNPFASTLINLALSQEKNSVILDAIICLSASQYQYALSAAGSILDNAESACIEKLKWQRHSKAITHHVSMLEKLSQPSIDFESAGADLQTLLTLTMILYQFYLCERTPSAGRQRHFNTARALIKQIYQDGRFDPIGQNNLSTFVFNWFYFHDVCSSLTSRQNGPCIDLHRLCLHGDDEVSPATSLATRYLSGASGAAEIILIGPHDGLLDILARIIRLHRSCVQYEAEFEEPDVEVLIEGLSIESDIRNWNNNYDNALSAAVAECYRLAAFILLWFTVHPLDPFDGEKAQFAVQEGLRLLELVPTTDTAQTCSLLPLFVFGVSANSKEQRNSVKAKIHSYASWASIANIIEVSNFLEQWWRAADKMDQTRRRWWDWEVYLKANEIDIFLV